ncbi:MAG TPA: VWA domain-containing protein [Bryobacteraceae bacterium]|nr:VWA domain-containing protein [Bryobacteraceae bacterium]
MHQRPPERTPGYVSGFRYRFRASATVVVFAHSLFGQAPATDSQPEITTHDAPATFRAGVNLVLVPVVVRDASGRAIGNLQKDDFVLLDRNKPQVITRFSIETPATPIVSAVAEPTADPGAAPAPTSPPAVATRFIAYVIDDVHLSVGDLAQARQAVTQYLDDSLEAVTRAAIFTTSGRTTLDFTDDRAKLRETLNRIQPWVSITNSSQDCPNPAISYYMADLIVNQNNQQALAAAAADYYACNPPPSNATQQQQQAAQQQAQSLAQANAQQQLSAGDQETRYATGVLRDVVRRIALMPGSRNIVLVSPGFYLTNDSRTEENELMDRAIRANVTINCLDARGLYVGGLEGDASQRQTGLSLASASVKSQYQRDSALANEDVMAELADATGGAFFHNNNDLREGLKRLAAQPEFIYVLGFSPQNLKFDGTFHQIKVTLKKPAGGEYALQARRGYSAPRHAIDPEEQARDEIREAVYSREELHDIPVDLNLQYFKPSDVQAKLSVLARVDIRGLRYRKVGDRNNDKLTIVSGIFDRNGNFISGLEKTVELRLRDETLAKLPASGINIRSTFDLTPGAYVLRLVVRDAEGQTMAARNGAVAIP